MCNVDEMFAVMATSRNEAFNYVFHIFTKLDQNICGNKIPTRCNRGFISDLISCSTCFGHQYAHHQELKIIIQWLLPVVFRAVVYKLLVWCEAEGYVLQFAGCCSKPEHLNSVIF